MMSYRSIRAKFEDVAILNGVVVFFSDRVRRMMRLAENLRTIGYPSTYTLRSVGLEYGKMPIAMSIEDGKRFFDDFGFEKKFERPDFETLEKFFNGINYRSVATSLYEPNFVNRSVKIKSYLFWLQDILPRHIDIFPNPTKGTLYVKQLEKLVNANQSLKPYLFMVDHREKYAPPKVFSFITYTLEDGKKVRLHDGLARKFGEEYGFFKTVDDAEKLPPLQRDSWLALVKVIN